MNSSSTQVVTRWPIAELSDHPRQATMFGDTPAADYDALVADIKQNGLQHPIEILPDGTVLAGHQRIRAARQLGWDEIDAIVREDLTDDPKAAEKHFIDDNLNRRQLSTLAKARCVARLIEIEFGRPVSKLGFSKKEKAKAAIAKRMGCSLRTVNRLLLVIQAPHEIHIAIEREYLSLIDGGKVSLLSESQQELLAGQLCKIYSNDGTTEEEKRRLVRQAVKAETAAAATPYTSMKSFQKLLRTISKDVLTLEKTRAELPEGCLDRARPLIGSTLAVLSRLHDSPGNISDPDDAGPR